MGVDVAARGSLYLARGCPVVPDAGPRRATGRTACTSLRRRHLPHAGAGGGRQRAPRGALHAPHLAGEPLRPGGGQPGRRAGHRAVHAADRRDARAHQCLRAAAGAARVGELPARAAHDLPRQSGPGRGGLQRRSRGGRGLARRAQRPSGRDPGLRHDRHGLCRAGLGVENAAAARGIGRAALASRDGRTLRRDRQVDDRADAPPSRSHRQPGLGAVGCPACRQLDRSRRPRRLRTAAPQIQRRPGRPPAAGARRPPACGLAVPRPGLGREPAGRERALREADRRRRQLHRLSQPAQTTRAGIATPWSSAGRTAGAWRYRCSSRRTSAHGAAAPPRACGARPRRRPAPCRGRRAAP